MTKKELNLAIKVRLNEMKPYLERMKGRTFNQKKYENLNYAKLRKVFNWLRNFQEGAEWWYYVQICKEFKHEEILRYKFQNLTDLSEYRAFFKKRKAVRKLWNETFPQEIKNGLKKKSGTVTGKTSIFRI